MSKTCQTCKHWKESTGHNYGHCDAAKKNGQDISPGGFASCAARDFGVITGPGFGCVLHEEKPREIKAGDMVKLVPPGDASYEVICKMRLPEESGITEDVILLMYPGSNRKLRNAFLREMSQVSLVD